MGQASRKKKEQRRKREEVWEPLRAATLKPNKNLNSDHRNALDNSFNEVWKNNLYTVFVRRGGDTELTHISFRRNDRGTSIDWRHKQYIKNEICGPEYEAVEIFPAESRLVDASNQFHLWVLPENAVVPGGFNERLVVLGGPSPIGAVQRDFEPDMAPDDALTPEQEAELFKQGVPQNARK